MNSEQPETDPWTLFIDELYACVHDIESRECLVAMAESLEEQSAVQRGLVRDTANGWQANYAEKDAELLALRAAHAQLREAFTAHCVQCPQCQTAWVAALAASPLHPETEGP